MRQPVVSVVIPSHNAARWIGEAIASLLTQRSIQDLDIIVVDDASADDTADVVQGVKDSRVRLITNGQNLGAAGSRNRGIELATGEFLAFMDADDVALPHRFEKQIAFLEANPAVDIVGGWMQTFGRRREIWPAHRQHDDIKAELLYACGMLQSTVVAHRDRFMAHGLRYDPAIGLSEDYDLWARCADVLRLANLQEVLVHYRTHDDNISILKRDRLVAANRTIRMRQLRKLGVDPTPDEAEFHTRLFEYGPTGPGKMAFDLQAVESWLLRLRDANRTSGYVPDRVLAIVLYEFWRRCAIGMSGSPSAALCFARSPLARAMPLKRRARDVVKRSLGLPLFPVSRS